MCETCQRLIQLSSGLSPLIDTGEREVLVDDPTEWVQQVCALLGGQLDQELAQVSLLFAEYQRISSFTFDLCFFLSFLVCVCVCVCVCV